MISKERFNIYYFKQAIQEFQLSRKVEGKSTAPDVSTLGVKGIPERIRELP